MFSIVNHNFYNRCDDTKVLNVYRTCILSKIAGTVSLPSSERVMHFQNSNQKFQYFENFLKITKLLTTCILLVVMQVLFIGTRGKGIQSDIALDELSITEGECTEDTSSGKGEIWQSF